MNSSTISAPADPIAPPHVPPHLVRNISFGAANQLPDPYLVTERVREELPPIYYYPGKVLRYYGAWVVTRHEDITQVYRDVTTFSTKDLVGYQVLAGETWPLIPLELDPPQHMTYRMMLNPYFSPKAMTAQEDSIRAVAAEMVDQLQPRGGCDFTNDFARIFPVRIFLNLMGMPFDRFDDFMTWIHLIHFSNYDQEKMAEGARLAIAYLREFVAEVRRRPGDNLTSHIVNASIDGRPITDDEVIGTVFFLWIGGLDTVAATLSLMFRRLALDPALQRTLRENPSLTPGAVEEFLRTQPLVNSVRTVTRDIELHGVQIKAGDRVLCLNVAANFDADEFDTPRQFDVHRKVNRHFTMAGGPHVCLGAPLARRELRIALDLWLERIPEFKLRDSELPLTFPGLQAAPNLPLVWENSR